MSVDPGLLLERLGQIAQAAASTGRALALIGLGSVGVELERMDEYSDLDFFIIARPGEKASMLSDLAWLHSVHPVGYVFQNTPDGYKALFEDGIFCEFAIFEPEELAQIPYAEGRVVWSAAGFDEALRRPQKTLPNLSRRDPDWLLGEALTCLYVGMLRFRRGEVLSAFRFIQVYAVDRLIELVSLSDAHNSASPDPFSPERRFEKRFPHLAADLPALMTGYDAAPQAALALLSFLEQRFEVDGFLRETIRNLCENKG